MADRKTGREWERDTIALVFSTTKGATAVAANHLAQAGALDVDAPVVEYWPEFGAAGKAAIPVSWLLSHQAGLPWVDEPITLEAALEWDPLIHALERQEPVWEPGTAHGYHAVTYGHLVGEVIRRVTGRTVGTYFAEEIARPLGLDFWIGLPEAQEPRVAPLVGRMATEGSDSAEAKTLTEMAGPGSDLTRALTVNGAFGGRGTFNTRAVRAAEIPAAGGVGDARSVGAHVRGVHRRCRRRPSPLPRADGRRAAPAHDRPRHRAPRPRSAVGSRVHRAVDPRAAGPRCRARSGTSAWVARSAGPTPTRGSRSAT